MALIDENVEAFYSDRITYAQFGSMNRVLWAAISKSGSSVEQSVLATIRSRMPAARPHTAPAQG